MSRVSKSYLFQILCALSIMSVIVSNIITNKQTEVFGFAVTCGSFILPLSYIVNDTMVEVFGFKEARRVTLLSFVCNLLAVVFFTLTLVAPSASTFTAQDQFAVVLGSTPRVLLASFTAYIIGSLSNAYVMQRMKDNDGERRLGLRCILSTVVGETLDMVIFTFMAFAGRLPLEAMIQIIVVSSVVKILVETVMYAVLTRHVIRWAKSLT